MLASASIGLISAREKFVNLVTAYCYENVTIRKIGLFDEEIPAAAEMWPGGAKLVEMVMLQEKNR